MAICLYPTRKHRISPMDLLAGMAAVALLLPGCGNGNREGDGNGEPAPRGGSAICSDRKGDVSTEGRQLPPRPPGIDLTRVEVDVGADAVTIRFKVKGELPTSSPTDTHRTLWVHVLPRGQEPGAGTGSIAIVELERSEWTIGFKQEFEGGGEVNFEGEPQLREDTLTVRYVIRDLPPDYADAVDSPFRWQAGSNVTETTIGGAFYYDSCPNNIDEWVSVR